MITEKYYSVSRKVAEMALMDHDRYKVAGDRFILTGSDIKDAVMAGLITPADFPTLDIVEVADAEANALIAQNGYEIGNEGGIVDVQEEEETAESQSEEETEESVVEQEAAEEEESEIAEDEEDLAEAVQEEPGEEVQEEASSVAEEEQEDNENNEIEEEEE